MATITNSSKYGEGHQIILKQSSFLSKQLIDTLKEFKYEPGKSVFSITKRPLPKQYNTIQISKGNDVVLAKDSKNNIVKFIGTASAINNTFNHYSDTQKGNTNLLTEIKENITMWQMQAIIESNRYLTEDEIIAKLGPNKQYYNTVYYTSALAQSEALKQKIVTTSGYSYERQSKDKTKKIYDVARKLTGKQNDNWNPADVWMIKNGFDLTKIYNSSTAAELNSRIAIAMRKRELIPISLKQVTSGRASVTLVDPANMMNQKLDLDLTFDKVDLSETFNNFIIWSKSGFGIRAGFKASSTTLNVSLEGRFSGSGYQVGAVDAKQYTNHVRETHRYTVRGSSTVPATDYSIAKAELKSIYSKYPRISNKIQSYEQAIQLFEAGDDLVKKRFSNLISYLFSFIDTPEKFEEHMKFCYYMSKKVSSDSCAYYIIQ